ncbi:hypothetical protein BpHYR1_033525 [Brachionus plicatilis]|uniref:Uncharacterized protein n=1 Tax=Brachionus plicatilis TaxID=10195 RepID=A0A3M7SFU8_BRAPC|nr:hypothetical protein BpHYR1_033525 [Brachionus plicatilis]
MMMGMHKDGKHCVVKTKLIQIGFSFIDIGLKKKNFWENEQTTRRNITRNCLLQRDFVSFRFNKYFSMCYVQGTTIGDLLVGHLRKLVLLKLIYVIKSQNLRQNLHPCISNNKEMLI